MMLPRDGQLRAEGRLRDGAALPAALVGPRRDAAEDEPLDRAGVSRAKKCASVVQTAHVIEYDNDRQAGNVHLNVHLDDGSTPLIESSVAAMEKIRAVIVGEDPAVLAAACDLLLPEVLATAVDNRHAAIRAVRRLRPNLAVLDVSMPGLDELQTAMRFKAERIPVRVVFLSDRFDDAFVVAGLSVGASGFVTKPRMRDDLVAAVRHVRGGRAFVPAASALPQLHTPRAGAHHLQIYPTDDYLIAAVHQFFAAALRRGDAALAVASAPHLQQIEARLTGEGFNVSRLAAEARYTPIDAREALAAVVEDGYVNGSRFVALFDPIIARASGAGTGRSRHVTAFGEMAPLLTDADAVIRFERLVSDFAAERTVSVLCGYHVERMTASKHLDDSICREHSIVVSGP